MPPGGRGLLGSRAEGGELTAAEVLWHVAAQVALRGVTVTPSDSRVGPARCSNRVCVRRSVLGIRGLRPLWESWRVTAPTGGRAPVETSRDSPARLSQGSEPQEHTAVPSVSVTFSLSENVSFVQVRWLQTPPTAG